MKNEFIWKLRLPIRFAINKDVSTMFSIHENVAVKLCIEGERYFQNIDISYVLDVDHQVDYSKISNEVLQLYNHVKGIIGPYINKFYKCLCQKNHQSYQNIYNGEEFVIPHALLVVGEGKSEIGGYDSYGVYPLVTQENLEIVINEFDKEASLVKQIFQDAQNFLDSGLLDMAILNAYVALEVCVKLKFSKQNTQSEIMYKAFSEIKENRFIEKYLVFGPYIFFKRSYKEENEELFNQMVLLDRLRNMVVHEGSALNYSKFIGKSQEDIYSEIEFLIDDVEETIEWVDSLKHGENFT